MNKRSKLFTISLACTITMGFMSHKAVPTLAATPNESKTITENQTKLNTETKQKVDAVLNKLDTDLAKIGVPVHKHHARGELFKHLDKKTKVKAKEILKKVKEGSITREEAHQQLKALGVSFPKHHKHEQFNKLDEPTKTKVKKIIENMKAGTITKEDAHKQLKALGVEFPKHHRKFKALDAETKEKAQALIDDAKIQLNKLGAEFPSKRYDFILK